jgi:hypothetical protein
MVQEYLHSTIDWTRASQPTPDAVANDLVEDWQRELLREMMPEGMEKMKFFFLSRCLLLLMLSLLLCSGG